MAMQKQGFTLVEIIIVLVLLAVLAMIAVPKYLNLIETAEIQAAKGALAEVQSRLNMTFYDWLLTGTKVKQNTTENNPNFRKGTAVTTLLPSSCLQAHGGSVANYQYGLADEGTSSCSATGTGTIGGWKVNMQSGEFIHFCEGNKDHIKFKNLHHLQVRSLTLQQMPPVETPLAHNNMPMNLFCIRQNALPI